MSHVFAATFVSSEFFSANCAVVRHMVKEDLREAVLGQVREGEMVERIVFRINPDRRRHWWDREWPSVPDGQHLFVAIAVLG